MRLMAKATALAILTLLAPHVVFADYVSDAAQALKSAPVYVASDTEGTDQNTAARLKSRLNENDRIVLVMLPSTAETTLGADITTIASRLSEELGNKKIIGLAVGNKVVGYAPSLPIGVASDQMRRADSVSNDPITALGTFTQNIHIWQTDNPEPEPSAIDSIKEGGSSWLLWLVLALIFVVIILSVIGSLMSSDAKQTSRARTRFKAPDQVKDLLGKIARESWKIRDPELKMTVTKMCEHIERYFAKSSSDKKRDSLFFKDRLTEVSQVLTKYVDVQDNAYYFHDAGVEMTRGKESITDFSEYVLESIRRGNRADLFDYRVNTNILQAQRFRSGSSL